MEVGTRASDYSLGLVFTSDCQFDESDHFVRDVPGVVPLLAVGKQRGAIRGPPRNGVEFSGRSELFASLERVCAVSDADLVFAFT